MFESFHSVQTQVQSWVQKDCAAAECKSLQIISLSVCRPNQQQLG